MEVGVFLVEKNKGRNRKEGIHQGEKKMLWGAVEGTARTGKVFFKETRT